MKTPIKTAAKEGDVNDAQCNELEVLARLVVDTAPSGDWPELADLARFLGWDEDQAEDV